ncbi:MAG TPA: DUF4129 domain-containing protein [Candidatus Microbacterium pullistercoris]|nr:DUF4129 domain-containing protein [Candidatus Microbacterium pullistercoris]
MRRWIGAVVVTALLVLAMIAAATQGAARFDPPDFSFGPMPAPSPAMPTQAPPEGLAPPDDAGGGGAAAVVTYILIALVAAVIIFVIVRIVRALLRAWRDRLPVRPSSTVAENALVAEDDPERAAPALRRGIAAAVEAIDGHRDPGDAIVAAWAGLEHSAADAGLTRGVSETPAEYTLRIVAHRTEVDGDVRALLVLYERVRFAGDAPGESERAAARRALSAIEEAWR